MKIQKKEGITLIALVITIIVLIILAGVSINLLTGANGIITRAKEGVASYKNAEQNEINILLDYNNQMESLTNNSQTAKIPEGFTVSTVPGETTIEEGLVVIGPDGSEFVWVPVLNPFLDVQGMNDIEIYEALDLEIAAERYPMAIKVSSTDYKGVLYDFYGTTVPVGIGVTIYSREPDILTGPTYGDTDSNLSTNGIGLTQSAFKTQLQNEYNQMVESVITNGGFYIGRYETSTKSGNVIQSKGNVAPLQDINWYSFYQRQKAYTSNNSITSVTSSMIWGSAWDQVMIWMKNVQNPYASNRPYVVDATGMGWYVENSECIVQNTGTLPAAKVKNIYDMAGNVLDWTQEASDTIYRTIRRKLLWIFRE